MGGGGGGVTSLMLCISIPWQEWDDTLATHAQQYSDMCIWAHGFPDVNITPFNPVGQNLWNAGPVTESDRPNPADVVQSWFNERDYYDYSSGTCDDGYDCGHYTQVNMTLVNILKVAKHGKVLLHRNKLPANITLGRLYTG